MDLSRDGRLLAIGQGYPASGIQVRDVVTGERIAPMAGKQQDSVSAIAFNHDASTLITGSYQTTRIWDIETQRELALLEEHKGADTAVEVSPDGTLFASAAADGRSASGTAGGANPSVCCWGIQPR